MSEKVSQIRNESGELIAIRTVEDYNGGIRVTTMSAETKWGGIEKGPIIDDRDVYPDGTEYEHKGRRLK